MLLPPKKEKKKKDQGASEKEAIGRPNMFGGWVDLGNIVAAQSVTKT